MRIDCASDWERLSDVTEELNNWLNYETDIEEDYPWENPV